MRCETMYSLLSPDFIRRGRPLECCVLRFEKCNSIQQHASTTVAREKTNYTDNLLTVRSAITSLSLVQFSLLWISAVPSYAHPNLFPQPLQIPFRCVRTSKLVASRFHPQPLDVGDVLLVRHTKTGHRVWTYCLLAPVP